MPRLTPEFAFVAACCAWPPAPERSLGIHNAANNLDWNLVLAIVRRHRVEGIFRHGLMGAGLQPPAQIGADLQSEAARVARESLLYAGETLRVQAALRSQGLRSLVLKGTAVELLAYGRLGLKSAKDIDLLVDEGDVRAAIETLRDCGYEPHYPEGLTPAEFGTWIRLGRDLELTHSGRGLQIELHWRLDDSPYLIRGISAASPAQQVQVSPGAALTTLRTEELFSYICVHGAKHGWSRLKWLADAAALASAHGEGALEHLYREAVVLGAGLCPAQAFLLMERLFGLEPPPSARDEILRRPVVRWLASVALDAMASGGGARELASRRFGTTAISASQLFLSGEASHALAELGHRWIRGPDLELYLSLRASRRWLYPWFRLRRWAGRHAHGL